jgi:beta-glucanase (GH16 family)
MVFLLALVTAPVAAQSVSSSSKTPVASKVKKHLHLPWWGQAPSVDDRHRSNFDLIFSDEFNGTSLDRSKWCTRLKYSAKALDPNNLPADYNDPACHGPLEKERGTLDYLNDEQQRYVDVDVNGTEMHEVSDGALHLIATKRPTPAADGSYYQSAMIRTKNQAKPAPGKPLYLVAQVRLPSGQGTWPALWTLAGWNTDEGRDDTWPPEIDIFEGPINNNGETAYTLHLNALSMGGKQTASLDSEFTYTDPNYDDYWNQWVSQKSLRDRWIMVAVAWTVDSVCYSIDGTVVACQNYHWVYDDGVAASPAQLIANLALGGGWPGPPDDKQFPTSLDINFIRIYRGR